MKIRSKYLTLELNKTLQVTPHDPDIPKLTLEWPAASLSVANRVITPLVPCGPPEATSNTISQDFILDRILFRVILELGKGPWFTKRLQIFSDDKQLPSPDFVEIDRQSIKPDRLVRCGYGASSPEFKTRDGPTGAGTMPGCGYPLIGTRIFCGIEHPAGFSYLNSDGSYSLKHYPVWDDGNIFSQSAVFGVAANATENFQNYLQSIRLPALSKPIVCYCTFWSDPYFGNLNFGASKMGYSNFAKAIFELGLRPDYLTLDCGWSSRSSMFRVKTSVGGDTGLAGLRRTLSEKGCGLSLWISHNGTFDPKFLKKEGYSIGSGQSATYSGDGFAVMMDNPFKATLESRFLQIAKGTGAAHFKIDWDNDCATNPAFNARYPTQNHVREANLNAFFEIGRKLREQNKDFLIRNGWWPSPWWLSEANHVWLPDSGDSEYAALPSKSQRDSSTTHRDLMYFNVLRRDHTPLPLDCFDNHEFADAPRNPFCEDPISFINAVWMSFMRGSSYLAYTLSPGSLEDWQAVALQSIATFCKQNAAHIITERSRMILGHPGRGELYGYLHPGVPQSWCVIRNPLPVPQTLRIDNKTFGLGRSKPILQIYPHFENVSKTLTFVAHELKILIIGDPRLKAAFAIPHLISKTGKQFECRFPSTHMPNKSGQILHPMHKVGKLRCLEARCRNRKEGRTIALFVQVPMRMREAELQIEQRGSRSGRVDVRAHISRYREGGSAYAAAVTKVSAGVPGCGEIKNLDHVQNDRCYYYVRIPAGGRFGIKLDFEGLSHSNDISLWLSGYEAPGLPVRSGKAPALRSIGLLQQHPVGFPTSVRIVL